LPQEAILAAAIDASGIHLHSRSLDSVDRLLEIPKIDIIEVKVDDVEKQIPGTVPWFSQILKRKRLYV
jgi:hypothetical protein